MILKKLPLYKNNKHFVDMEAIVGGADGFETIRIINTEMVKFFKSVAKEIAMLEGAGNKLKLPHSRALGKGLFELRERRYGYRVYYGFRGEYVIILLAVGDKRSQETDIKVARKRLSQIREE